MAVFAWHGGMQADQRKAGELVIERDALAPGRRLVAKPAAAAQLPAVRILSRVAPLARHGWLGTVKGRCVAAFASHLGMRADKCEPRRRVMIEIRFLPCLLRVAGLAFLSIAPRMLVFTAVARDAGAGKPLVAFLDMARRTRDTSVGSNERKSGLAVIEAANFSPALLVVAASTIVAQVAFVRIGCFVAPHACCGRRAKFLSWLMAGVAGHALVTAEQREVSACVIEELTVELEDVSIPPLVLGVTSPAVGL